MNTLLNPAVDRSPPTAVPVLSLSTTPVHLAQPSAEPSTSRRESLVDKNSSRISSTARPTLVKASVLSHPPASSKEPIGLSKVAQRLAPPQPSAAKTRVKRKKGRARERSSGSSSDLPDGVLGIHRMTGAYAEKNTSVKATSQVRLPGRVPGPSRESHSAGLYAFFSLFLPQGNRNIAKPNLATILRKNTGTPATSLRIFFLFFRQLRGVNLLLSSIL
jgi:hypothetical protein